MKIIPLSSALLVMLLSLVSYAFSHPQKLEMPTRDIKTLGLKVPFLGLGTVELGRDWGIGGEQSIHPDEYRAKKVLQKALQVGYTLVDSASSYQLSEERIGRYIPQHSNRYLLITKPGEHSIKADDKRCKQPAYDNIYCAKPASEYDFSHDAIVKDIDNSLKLLKVKTLDVALLHLNNKDAENILAQGIAVQTLQELKAQGKIKYIGVSVNGKAALTAAKMKELDFLETEYSLINQTNEKAIRLAAHNGQGVIVRGGLGTGLLTEKVAAHLHEKDLPYGDAVRSLLKLTNNNYNKLTALALAFLFKNPDISTVIIGADQPQYLRKNLKSLLNFKDHSALKKAEYLMNEFTPTDFFTENMGEYYFTH